MWSSASVMALLGFWQHCFPSLFLQIRCLPAFANGGFALPGRPLNSARIFVNNPCIELFKSDLGYVVSILSGPNTSPVTILLFLTFLDYCGGFISPRTLLNHFSQFFLHPCIPFRIKVTRLSKYLCDREIGF